MKIEKEDFDAWRDNLVTQKVMAHVLALVEQAKSKWMQVSWEGGSSDPVMLADLRARAEIASDLASLRYEDVDDNDNESKVAKP